jgi:hypothetical protein
MFHNAPLQCETSWAEQAITLNTTHVSICDAATLHRSQTSQRVGFLTMSVDYTASHTVRETKFSTACGARKGDRVGRDRQHKPWRFEYLAVR